MSMINKDRAKAAYDQAGRIMDSAEKFKHRYPLDWKRVVRNFNRAKRAYEKTLETK